MNHDSTAMAANLLRAHASRMRQCGEPFDGVSDDLDAIADGLARGTLDMYVRVLVEDSLWKLSMRDARREVTRRLEQAVAAQIAKTIALDDVTTRYTRYLADGSEAPPDAAGKRIDHYRIEASFALVPIQPPKES